MTMEKLMEPMYAVQSVTNAFTVGVSDGIPENVWKLFTDAHVILWLHSGIHTGQVKSGQIVWNNSPEGDLKWDRHLVELRVFDQHQEYRIWRSNGQLKYRHRKDSDSLTQETLDAWDTEMPLRAVVAMPFGPIIEGKGNTLVLKTRNYLGLNGCGMVGYVDCRFVEIIRKEN